MMKINCKEISHFIHTHTRTQRKLLSFLTDEKYNLEASAPAFILTIIIHYYPLLEILT